MGAFDDEVLLLSPVAGCVGVAGMEQHLAATPGAFQDPLVPSAWFLSSHPREIEALRRERVENPTHIPCGLARVVVSPDRIVVYPDYSTGRARQFVTWLLSQGACELTVGGDVIGRVASPSDIYQDDTWEDPDSSADPTESPPRAGTVVVIERHHDVGGIVSEDVIVHDSGVMSYEQLHPVRDPVKTYRRLSPEALARWLDLVKHLPLKSDVPADGTYVDPVFVRVETPTNTPRIPKLDAARPTEPYRELMLLVNCWVAALREDRAAMLPGLLPFP